MKKITRNLDPFKELRTEPPSESEDESLELEKDKMTSEGGLPDEPSNKIKIHSRVYFERKYKESTPRQFMNRIFMKEDNYEKFHWY